VADFIFNIAKGRIVEYANRINVNDPANSVFQVSLWNYGAATDDTIGDLDTVALVESNANAAELTSGTNANYARKTINDASGMTITVDDTNNRTDVDIADQTWTALGAGTAVTDLVVAYDSDSTGGTDANQVPVSSHDFVITPDGSDVTAVINASGIFRAA
jgi:hypothetical protein